MSTQREQTPAVSFNSHTVWWVAAIVLFGVADVAVTLFALYGYAPESHFAYLPILNFVEALLPVSFFYQLVAALTGWKIATVAFFYWLYRVTPREHRIGVPVGLTSLGLAVLAWNLHAIGLY